MTPKATRNPKLKVNFVKCASMTPCPPLVQPLLENVKLESTEILEISFFLFTSSDPCHKMMLLES